MKYTFKTFFPENCTDKNGNINPNTVLGVFQKAANIHGDMLGVSFDEMMKKNLLWVVTRIHYRVYGNAVSGQEIEITTWPLAPSRLGYERDYIITDLSGNVIIKGTSNWAVIDADTRHLSVETSLYNRDDYSDDRAIEEKIRRIRKFDAQKTAPDVTPDKSMIDCNNHVNNTYYALFAVNAMGELDGKIKSFQIDYHHEVLCGETVRMSIAVSEGGVHLVKGEAEDGTLKFSAAIELK